MNVNFELYKVFYQVAKEKSITKGANKLMISQPAVTQSIKTLEDELGGQLFIRTSKGVVLTHEGEELFHYISEGMNYFINGTNKFTSLKNLSEGVLNIGSTSTISSFLLMPYLKKFHEKYPNIEIIITNDITSNLIKNLINGSLDIIITSIPNEINNSLIYKQISTLHDIFVGTKDYIKKINNSNELLKNNLLLPKYPSITRINFNEYLKNNNLSCEPKMEVASQNLLISLAENNFGIALVPKEYLQGKLNKTLFEIETSFKIKPRKIGYALAKMSIPTFTAAKFIAILDQ